jgi:hypothetical protein
MVCMYVHIWQVCVISAGHQLMPGAASATAGVNAVSFHPVNADTYIAG